MLSASLSDLSVDFIKGLASSGELRESSMLDFKRDYSLSTDEQKREFLGDVTALANSHGGDVIFGIEESKGIATSAPGISLENPDSELLRVEGVLQTGAEPRVPNVQLRWIPDGPQSGFLVVRVPRSWNAPHRVKQNNRFFARNSAGKYPMDVTELRASFLAAEGIIERIRRFRKDRVELITGDQSPIPIDTTEPKVMLHILPLSAFLSPLGLQPEAQGIWLQPLNTTSGWHQRYTLEGYLTYVDLDGAAYDNSYALLFRTGAVEAVGNIGRRATESGDLVFLGEAETTLSQKYIDYRDALMALGATGPIVVFATLINIEGTKNYVHAPWEMRRTAVARQGTVMLPEVLVESPSAKAFDDIGSIINSMWQVYGYPRSPQWDANGNPTAR
ncbi:MAG TPA: ATP-binding protein [Sphingomonas sp.]|uniref:AlbA family DNA-binding domain-containing protein n=1 Tax=Sphingomonas sp. TaxID=28214 RepID=UPI002C8622FD|nr:ATP-binding protein [Sphingomonas sp.]HMI18040.1 ATP-binding protein [Sphingomonas sp.]